MRSRILKLLHPDRSRLHPKYSPFTVQYSSNKEDKIAVFNCKDKRALVCESGPFLLDPCCDNFDLTNNKTYFTLCNWDPNTVWSQVQRVVAHQKKGFGKSSGPYTLSYTTTTPPSITIHSTKGGKHTFKYSTKELSSVRDNTANKPSLLQQNRYSILMEDDDEPEDTTDNNKAVGKHSLRVPHQNRTPQHK